MKVLVATRESQGSRERDLWRSCIDGELVRPIEERCALEPGRGCSCETAFIGVASGGLTTTAVVRDIPSMTPAHYERAIGDSLTEREAGFILVDRYAEELARVAGSLRGEGPIERWDEWIGLRFEEDGALREDITGIADVDPAELEDLR